MARTDAAYVRDPHVDALRRWLEGQDEALEEWLSFRVRPLRRRPRTLALP